MLQKLLGLDKFTSQHSQDPLFHYLPVSTSLAEQLETASKKLFNENYQFSEQNIKKANEAKNKPKWGDFTPNIETEAVKDDLVMLKLRNMIDQTKFTKTEEIKKIPKKVQKGVVIEGDGFEMKKIKKVNKHKDLVEQLLELDQQKGYTTRKFSELQKLKQRRRKITKKSLLKKSNRKTNKSS